jgi:hypothetical protein
MGQHRCIDELAVRLSILAIGFEDARNTLKQSVHPDELSEQLEENLKDGNNPLSSNDLEAPSKEPERNHRKPRCMQSEAKEPW